MISLDGGECQSAEDEGIEQDSGEAEESAAASASATTTTNAAMTMTSLSHVMDVSPPFYRPPFCLNVNGRDSTKKKSKVAKTRNIIRTPKKHHVHREGKKDEEFILKKKLQYFI